MTPEPDSVFRKHPFDPPKPVTREPFRFPKLNSSSGAEVGEDVTARPGLGQVPDETYFRNELPENPTVTDHQANPVRPGVNRVPERKVLTAPDGEDNDGLLEIELDPFQNFRFRRRPADMRRFGPRLPELGTNFDLSRFESPEEEDNDDDDDEDDEEEELQRLSMIAALQPPSTFRPLFNTGDFTRNRNSLGLGFENSPGTKNAIDSWRKGLKGGPLEADVEPTSEADDDVVDKFRHLISERL